MADKSDLMKLSKEEVVDGFQRMAKRAKTYKEKAAAMAEDVMDVALAGGAAFGIGFYMGNIKGQAVVDQVDPTEDLKLFGIDKDLLVGATLGGLGLSGVAGKKASPYFKSAGVGVLSYWAGSAGERMAIERATDPDA